MSDFRLTSQDQTSRPQSGDLMDMLAAVWRARVAIAFAMFLGGLLAFLFVHFAVAHYRAQIILSPAQGMNLVQNTALDSGGHSDNVASGQDAAGIFQQFQVRYKSAAVADLLLRDPQITQGLAQDRDFNFTRSSAQQGWSADRLAEYIADRVRVDGVGESALRRFYYYHPDKEFGVLFLQRLHNITDGLIRHNVRVAVNERIVYLNGVLDSTMNPNHRRNITALLMEQERLKMLVSIDQPYAADVVVAASASVHALWPDATLVYAVFLALGAFLGFVLHGLVLYARGDVEKVEETLRDQRYEQHDWYFPESGNNNEKPLTGGYERRKNGRQKKHDTPDAAE